jgi:hypothetical protein
LQQLCLPRGRTFAAIPGCYLRAVFPDRYRSHRLEILTSDEMEELFGLPRFTEDGRRIYFDFDPGELHAAAAYTFAPAPHFLLQLGYFSPYFSRRV